MTMHDSPAKRLLSGFADVLIVGLIITVCSIPLLTAYAAFRAGVLTLRVDDGNLLARYLRHLKAHPGRSLLSGTLFLLATAIAVVDLTFVLAGQSGPLGVGVGVVGVVLLVVVAVGPSFSAALETDIPCPVRQRLLHVALAAARHPLRCLSLIITTAAGTVIVMFAPITAPLVVGALARIASRIPASELVLSHTA